MKSIFPVVALDYPSTVQVNLGDSPFMFNLQTVYQQAQATNSDADLIPLEILVGIFDYAITKCPSLNRMRCILNIALTCHWWKSALFDSCSNPIWEKMSKKKWRYLREMDVKVRNWARFYKTRSIAVTDYITTTHTSGKFLLPIENCVRLNREYDGQAEPAGNDIDDSGLKWERKCPLIMGNLGVTFNDFKDSFHCGVCNEDVFRVFTQEELLDRTQKGQCVLYFVGDKRKKEGRKKMGKRRRPSGREMAEKNYRGKAAQQMLQMRLQNRGQDSHLKLEAVLEAKREVQAEVNREWAEKQKQKGKTEFKQLEFDQLND